MANQKQTLTASNLRYLLVLRKIGCGHKGVRGVDIADSLGVTKPSAHAMMTTLKNMNLIQQSRYGAAYFTEEGEALAELYSGYYDTVFSHFQQLLPCEADASAAAWAVLSEVSRESLEIMCRQIKTERK